MCRNRKDPFSNASFGKSIIVLEQWNFICLLCVNQKNAWHMKTWRARMAKGFGPSSQKWLAIDRLHKRWPKRYSFVFLLIRPTSLILKEHFFCILSVPTRLVNLISMKRKEYIFGCHLCHRSTGQWCIVMWLYSSTVP